MMVFADSCTFKGLPVEARRIIDCLQSAFYLRISPVLMFLIPANAIAYNGVTSRDWDMSYHLMWSNGKKIQVFPLE